MCPTLLGTPVTWETNNSKCKIEGYTIVCDLLGWALAGGRTGVRGSNAFGSWWALEVGARVRFVCGKQVTRISRTGKKHKDGCPATEARPTQKV